MKKRSAGILFYRFNKKKLEVLLVHPGGPFWAKKDAGAWTIPKGEIENDEDPLLTAIREVKEETGINVEGNLIELTPVIQKSGKLVYAWAVETQFEPSTLVSNLFEMEWPPRSGKTQSFPEIDRAEWFSADQAKEKILDAQKDIIIEMEQFFTTLRILRAGCDT